MLYNNLFNHNDVEIGDKKRIVEIIEKIERYIRRETES
jgi:hypothetical protein